MFFSFFLTHKQEFLDRIVFCMHIATPVFLDGAKIDTTSLAGSVLSLATRLPLFALSSTKFACSFGVVYSYPHLFLSDKRRKKEFG